MDYIAEIGSGPPTTGNLVGKACENAPGQRVVGSRRGINIKTLPFGKGEKLLKDACGLSCRITMDRKLTAAVCSEVIFLSPTELPPPKRSCLSSSVLRSVLNKRGRDWVSAAIRATARTQPNS